MVSIDHRWMKHPNVGQQQDVFVRRSGSCAKGSFDTQVACWQRVLGKLTNRSVRIAPRSEETYPAGAPATSPPFSLSRKADPSLMCSECSTCGLVAASTTLYNGHTRLASDI